ncbi:phospholipid carrier-dependent glycosyltransferase [Patescibacteria group bacterium]
MKKNKLLTILFILVIIVGGILRFTKILNFPPSLNWDEVSHGYNTYSILKTGSDEWGKKFPIINFRAYGDYPLPLNLYLTIPSIYFLGLNEFSIRFPHMFLGFLTIISAYFLTLGLTKDKKVSLLTALLVAIGPWFFFTSKVVFQSNISVFLLTSAMAMFVNRKKSRFLLPLSFLFLYLTLFSYHSTRIFSPIFLVGLIFFIKKEFIGLLKQKKIEAILSLIIVFVFFTTLPLIFLNPESTARSQWVFVINQGVVNRIIELRQTSRLPSLITRLIYNRPVFFVKEFFLNYFGYFSPIFLFFKGGTQYQFSLQNHGLLFLVNLPFYYFGLLLFFKNVFKEKETKWKIIFFWLVISLIPASITSEKFAVLRSTTILPLPQILISLAFFRVKKLLKDKKLKYIFLLVYLFSLVWSFRNYYFRLTNDYPKKYSSSWQYSYREVSGFIEENYDNYDKIIVTKKYGEPHEFLLFNLKWDPSLYKKDENLIRFYQSYWWWVDSFDKFYFVNDWDISKEESVFKLESGISVDCKEVKCLLVTESDKYPLGWGKIKSYNFLDGKEAFGLYEN